MHFLDLTLPALAANLALDESLLLHAEAGGPELLRIWQWATPAVVLGAGGKVADDVNEEACRADQVPITRRSSGGGTVLLGPGCLLYSLILPIAGPPGLKDVNASYRHILGKMAAAFADLVPNIGLAGTSDLACAGRKFSGNSQQRKRTHFLHHGTLLFAFDLASLPRYLKQPPRQPSYRADRTHLDFLMNLPTDAIEIVRRLRGCWQAWEPLTTWPHEMVQTLASEKFATDAWTYRR